MSEPHPSSSKQLEPEPSFSKQPEPEPSSSKQPESEPSSSKQPEPESSSSKQPEPEPSSSKQPEAGPSTSKQPKPKRPEPRPAWAIPGDFLGFGEGQQETEQRVSELMSNRDKWYDDVIEYWKTMTPDVKGMLQGYEGCEEVSNTDCIGSQVFLEHLKADGHLKTDLVRALDCGGGVGRVSKGVLTKCFKTVDILEQMPSFTAKIREYLGEEDAPKCENIFTESIQDFQPQVQVHRYDMVWIQWVVGHITDVDLVAFLSRCVKALTHGGLICLKENVSGVDPVFDEDDCSVTRNKEKFDQIFKAAKLEVVSTSRQKGFPKDFFAVDMIALKPSCVGLVNGN